ncbi:MAG TPA: tetratricopeptide repeat protein [Pyrinomonadaceae bacterium]
MLKRWSTSRPFSLAGFCAVFVFALMLSHPVQALAQAGGGQDTDRQRAGQLLNESKFTEALPLLEKISAANPQDAETMFYMGFARFASSKTIKGAEARKQARARARQEMARAKELGFKHALLEQILESVPADGGGEDKFSENTEADEAMREAEAAFAQGKLDQAIEKYQRALQLDPKLYMAALFTGDAYIKKNEPERADEWFARAISINPDIETAYRYWATGLTARGKTAEARDKLVEAFITEPFNRLARQGLVQWAQQNNVRLAHPKFDVPTNVSSSGQNKTTINIDPSMLGNKDDGSAAWLMYGIERASWNGKKFTEKYPNEKTYRHSLAEETSALRLVVQSAREQLKDKKVKQLDPSLANLIKLDDAGLLEAYILLARYDEGIVQDYAGYRKTNRDKLRRYVVEYLLAGGGK